MYHGFGQVDGVYLIQITWVFKSVSRRYRYVYYRNVDITGFIMIYCCYFCVLYTFRFATLEQKRG